ncbi:titin homolog [Achroia grisella]|uniref:titin homolog n=1 Tax=Achroia grisella TaxID=688607 RepID=UPI0027D2C4C6|nr:titin homolog [Achroia grisella]
MDDIYDNLENYDEGNVIDELKTENKNLKQQLEEYALTIDKLQKNILQDFDKLTLEYSKLESNYSSLLKTARAEVERKTQIITNLNKEKDMLVLNSRMNKNLLNIQRNNNKINKNTEYDTKKKNITNVPDGLKSNNPSAIRSDQSKTSTEDTVTNVNRDTTIEVANVSNKIEQVKLTIESASDVKENIKQMHTDKDTHQTQRKPCSISNRRKSMPANREYSKFVSDEECEDNYSREEVNKHKKDLLPLRHDTRRKSRDRSYNSKQSKLSDNSSTDDKHFSRHESSKDTHSRTRTSKKSDDDRYRRKDNYELRHRRHYSPERPHRKSTRDYPEDRYQRYGRTRVLESPPRDRFEHFDRRIDLRSKYDKDYNDYHPEKFRNQPSERQSGKHKIVNDCDEVTTKRMKTDSFSKYNDEIEPINPRNPRGKGPDINTGYPITEGLEANESCQSPDYISVDATSVPPVTEIKCTAATKLDDPRVTNKRYVMKSENGKTVLSTVIGRNVNLEIIDKSVWNIEKVDMPEALLQHPSQYVEEYVKEIYEDIENPVSNQSLESGEIPSSETQEGISSEVVANYETSYNEFQPKTEQTQCLDSINKVSQCEKSEYHCNNGTKLKYKIPKIKSRNNSEGHTQNVLPLSLDIDSTNKINCQKDPTQLQVNRHDNLENVDNCKEIGSKFNDKNLFKTRKIIEGDLQLSDEASDPIPENMVDVENIMSQENETGTDNYKNIQNSSDKTMNEQSSKITKKQTEKASATKNSESCLKGAVKRRSHRSQKKSKEVSPKEDIEKKSNKKMESENGDTVCEEIKTKFCDLFGDSSSLITPEDLGLNVSQRKGELSTYIPIFEDAQDAVDVNVKKGRQIQISSPELKTQSNEISAMLQIKNDLVPKSITEIKKGKPKKDIEDISNTVEINIENSLQCNNPHFDKLEMKNDIVKTIIISTGVQPQYTSVGNDQINVKQQIVSNIQNEPYQNNIQKSHDIPMIALATSTPERELQLCGLEKGTNCRITELSCKPNESRVVPADNIISMVDHSSTADTIDSQNDGDAPDVRIFVKRRRRTIRKVTPSKT